MTALKCPICGKPLPPPVRKGGRPRKFCSYKCAVKASHEYRKTRGYRHPKTHRIVCAFCGEVFMTADARQRFCSHLCAARARGVSVKRLRKEMAENHERKLRQLESCRETAPITVDCVRTTDGRTLVVETRGRCCVGWRSSGHVSHG